MLNISTKHSPKRLKFKRSNVVSTTLKGAVNDSQHSRTCRGPGGQLAPKFPRFGQNSNFSDSDKKVFGQDYNFSGSDMKNLGKVRSFRALTMINCKK